MLPLVFMWIITFFWKYHSVQMLHVSNLPSSITDMLIHSCDTYVKMIRGWGGGSMTDRPKWFVLFEKHFRWVSFVSSWVIYTATSGWKQQKLAVLLTMAFRLQWLCFVYGMGWDIIFPERRNASFASEKTHKEASFGPVEYVINTARVSGSPLTGSNHTKNAWVMGSLMS